MAYNISAFAGAGAQFFDNNGDILSGGLLYVYTAGTTTPVTTWTSNSGAVANTNPIVLDSAGRVPYEIWLNSGVTYKFVLKTSTGVTIGTYDNIPAIDDPTVFNNLITVTGTDTLIGTSTPPCTAYVAGMTISFVPVNTNTGAVTIDLDGLGAKNIYVGSSTTLAGGEIVAGRIVQLEYDGTRFQLYQSTIGAGTITNAMLANNAVTTAKIADGNVTPAKLSTGGPTWDANGNLGVDTALNAWSTSYSAVQLGTLGAVASTGILMTMSHGTYTDASGINRYASDTIPGAYTQFGSTHSWSSAPSGSTGDVIAWQNVMEILSGQLRTLPVGGTSLLAAYASRAWVNFNGTGTTGTDQTIRSSGNVTSVYKNATGDYTVNFTYPMPDANYAVSGSASKATGPSNYSLTIKPGTTPTTSAVNVTTGDYNANYDCPQVSVVIFR